MLGRKVLKDSIETLKLVRAELLKDGKRRVEDSSIKRIDQVIRDLERECKKRKPLLSSDELLKLLASCVEMLPYVAKLIDLIGNSK